MHTALVFPPFFFEPMYNMPPLGLINIATVLKEQGHSSVIFDFPLAIRLGDLPMGRDIYDACARKILQAEPEVAAFSVQCTTYPPALRIAERLKALKPGIKTVFGGHNGSFVDAPTLGRFGFLDAMVRGEGEITFPELLRAFEDGSDLGGIDGITYRGDGEIVRNRDRALIQDLDTLPMGDYSLVPPLRVYRDACSISRSIAILEVGRGCPHHCIYCSQSLLWQRKSRTFSIPRLIGEMLNLRDSFGAECFLLAYDQFTAKRDFAEEFCRAVLAAGLNTTPWYCISRLDTVDKPLLQLMRDAGCESMCYGIDSGSPRTLAFIRKKIDRDILFDRVRDTTGLGIVPTLSFVIGFPEEEKSDLEETLRLALQCAVTGNTNILVQMATTLPGTDLHASYWDRLVREVDTYFSFGIEFDGSKRFSEDDALINSDPFIFSSFYNLPCPAGPLKSLNEIARSFSVVAALYPCSLLLLSLETGRPVHELFQALLDHAERATSTRALTPQSCYGLFRSFATGLLDEKEAIRREYLPEIFRYETLIIEAGRFETKPRASDIDMNGPGGIGPLRSENILCEQFTFDIPDLIMELKSGQFPENYRRRAVHLLFRNGGGTVDVKEINDFGVDFLRLCDGKRSLQSIAEELMSAYGEGKGREEFADLCAEAASALADLRLIVPGPAVKS
ncbi:MAG: radical SAM protein [Desulfobacteraceae bacterium]|nr:radical SAM protein [Desulfobacteraceae bacterium]